MKKLVALVFVVSAAGLGFAGFKNTRLVTVSSNHASGALGAARATSDNTQYIGCYVYGNEAYNFRSVSCFARDALNRGASCYSDNPAIVDIAGRLNSDSYVGFSISGGTCISIRVDTMSYEVPKQ